ncbi:hypothetical protein BDV19DRAFT_384651 [Aspergillus venezuelensis]
MGSLTLTSDVDQDAITNITSTIDTSVNAMLFASSLPTGTPTAIGSTVCGIKKYIALQLELHTTCYVHFINVPPAIVRPSDDHPIEIFGVKGARIYYDEGARDLIVKLVEKPHEVAHGALTKKLLGQTLTMNLDSELSLDGATRVTSRGISKEPDASFSPWTLPPARSRQWPAVVVECGYSESTNHLRAMANLWISNSNGDVKVAIIISIERPRAKIILEKWVPRQTARSMGPSLRTRGQHARCEQEIVITRNEDGSAAISGAPLVIHFEEMFLRALVPPNEHDFVITGADLESIAREIWSAIAYLVSAQ